MILVRRLRSEKRDWTRTTSMPQGAGLAFAVYSFAGVPGEFHPITAYLFVDYKCNLDCWYCWAFNNKVKGMTEDVASDLSTGCMIVVAACWR